MSLTRIAAIQGESVRSPLAGERVLTRGVVTGGTRKGFFIQDPDGDPRDDSSHGLFVFRPRHGTTIGSVVEVEGIVHDFVLDETDRPTTQLVLKEMRVVTEDGPGIEPTWLNADLLSGSDLARTLNSFEGMLVGIQPGATFIAPSNPFGDYVVLPKGLEAPRTVHQGVRIRPDSPHLWYPSFRVLDYKSAPQVNVGAELLTAVVGPLNFRSSAFQVAARKTFRAQPFRVVRETTRLATGGTAITVLTLNGFNLDAKVEDPTKVNDPGRDIDDDYGDRRFDMLGRAMVEQAGGPDIVALQEIQDNDGAEMTDVVDASRNYKLLIDAAKAAGGPTYSWADVPPGRDEDGGQPGGNIRNGFLFNPSRVELLPDTLTRIAPNDPSFDGSRKPLRAHFRLRETGAELAVINVHLASKRNQHGAFAPERPGFDPRLELRMRQADLVRGVLIELNAKGTDYYVTGDFNDYEFSPTLERLLGDESINLVDRIPANQRYDYNHRGVSQVLMHGIVSKRQAAEREIGYEILHGNELIGTQPGQLGEKPTDHAYVIARLETQ